MLFSIYVKYSFYCTSMGSYFILQSFPRDFPCHSLQPHCSIFFFAVILLCTLCTRAEFLYQVASSFGGILIQIRFILFFSRSKKNPPLFCSVSKESFETFGAKLKEDCSQSPGEIFSSVTIGDWQTEALCLRI